MTFPTIDLGVQQTLLEPAPRLAARLGLRPEELGSSGTT